jgi:hypothetical protein
MEHLKGNGALSSTESCPREHVHSGKCSQVDSGNFPNFSKQLEKFGEFGEKWLGLSLIVKVH